MCVCVRGIKPGQTTVAILPVIKEHVAPRDAVAQWWCVFFGQQWEMTHSNTISGFGYTLHLLLVFRLLEFVDNEKSWWCVYYWRDHLSYLVVLDQFVSWFTRKHLCFSWTDDDSLKSMCPSLEKPQHVITWVFVLPPAFLVPTYNCY